MTEGTAQGTTGSATFRLGADELAGWDQYIRHHLGDADTKWIWASAATAFLLFLLVQRRDVAAGAPAVWVFAVLVAGLVAVALVWDRRRRWRRNAQAAALLAAGEVTIDVREDGVVLRTPTSHEVHPWGDVLRVDHHRGIHVIALRAPPGTVRGVVLPGDIPPSVLEAVENRLAPQPGGARSMDAPRP